MASITRTIQRAAFFKKHPSAYKGSHKAPEFTWAAVKKVFKIG